MNDKKLLNIITAMGIGGWILLFRKGPIKDWFLIYLGKTFVSTLMDIPVIKRKYVKYPIRYFSNSYNSNIVYIYIIFPLLCVIYNQYTYKMNSLTKVLSVFIFSVPMTIAEYWLEKKTNLIKYSKKWNSFYTLCFLTSGFWIVRVFITGIRFLDEKRNSSKNEDVEVENA